MQNGHCLHQLEPTDDAEVTGIIPLTDKKIVIAVGWNRKIVTYDISHPEVNSTNITSTCLVKNFEATERKDLIVGLLSSMVEFPRREKLGYNFDE